MKVLLVLSLLWTTSLMAVDHADELDAAVKESEDALATENPDRTDDERKQAIADEVETLDEKEEYVLKCDKPTYVIYPSYDEAQQAADNSGLDGCAVEPA